MPLGRDATVSYGSIDFKFSNDTKSPVKIVASASGGINDVRIYGIKEHPARTIEMQTQCTGTYAPKVERIEDPTLPAGEVKIEQKGSNGSTYITYKITKENGNVIKTETLTKSSYSAQDTIERVGTREQVPTTAPLEEEGDKEEALTPEMPEVTPDSEDGGQRFEE